MLKRAYFHSSINEFLSADPSVILGCLAADMPFDLVPQQRNAWIYQIDHISKTFRPLSGGHLFLEFLVPRMGRRVDLVLIFQGLIFVIEYKVGKKDLSRHDQNQVVSYALDLKNFHEPSHGRLIFPLLVATESREQQRHVEIGSDGVASVIFANSENLVREILEISVQYARDELDPLLWMRGRYKPTPTIIEAAQALYQKHDVQEISRSEAGVENLLKTSRYVESVIEESKRQGKKSICFVTGVPGSGKTLAGLNIVNSRAEGHGDQQTVFLSGNGPLVAVLREALAADSIVQSKAINQRYTTKNDELKKAEKFVQNIHHFRDAYLLDEGPPIERVVVFDEAQRAWNVEQTSRFMATKKGLKGFSMSEPEFLLSVMNRHDSWCTVVCLVGEGQEINTGEAGIAAWLTALQQSFPDWNVHLSSHIASSSTVSNSSLLQHFLAEERIVTSEHLHLAVSVRSFRAEHLSNFISAVLNGDCALARTLLAGLRHDYPIFLSRDLYQARSWLRSKTRGLERSGILASSNGLRLKPSGVFVKAKIDPPTWFLAPADDIRSSNALEDAGTEFDVQGLEIDWACVCIDGNLRRSADGWATFAFKGTKWQKVADPGRKTYVINSYRVLLTRARQGMVIFVPRGDENDATRSPSFYDPLYAYLRFCGIPELEEAAPASGPMTTQD